MISVNDHQNKACEVAQVVLSLFRIASQQELHDIVQWLGKPLDVDPSEQLPAILFDTLLEVQACDRCDHVEEEGRLKVAESDLVEVFISVGALKEVESDLKTVYNINKVFDLDQGHIVYIVFTLLDVWILKHENEGSHRESVNDKKGDAEVPDGDEGAVTVDEVPR